MLTLSPKAKLILKHPLTPWAIQMILGGVVLLLAFVVVPSQLDLQMRASREADMQELAGRLIAHSIVMAEEQSEDVLAVLQAAIEQQSLMHPDTFLSIDHPVQIFSILSSERTNSKDILGQVDFSDSQDRQHTLYYQATEVQPGLARIGLLQAGIVAFYLAVALGLPWILRGLRQRPGDGDAGQPVQPGNLPASGQAENDGLPFGVLTVDASGRVEHVNSQAARLLRIPPELLIGTSATELEALLAIPGTNSQVIDVLKNGQSKGFLIELLHQEQPHQVFVTISRLGANPPQALLMLQDRSDYRRLSARTNLLQQVLDTLPCAIIAIDSHNRVIALNESAALIFDIEKSKCLGRVLASSLAQLMPSLANHEEAAGLKLSLGTGADDVQYDLRTHHLHDFHGRRQGTVCIISDKTSELSLAEQVKRNERLAVIGQMAAGTLHEIRNPLAAVRGFAQLMAHVPDADKTREYSELTMLEIDRIDQIFSEFLLLSRAVEPDMVPVEIGDVLEDTLQLLQALFEQRHIRIHIDRWQAGSVLGDAKYLQQVFLHLLYNALDATPAGGSVSIELARLGQVVSITITDTGSGMDEEELSSCFDPFFTTKETGTGLGLTICQRLLDQMNGFIKIDSSPGDGTIVRLSFPLAAPQTE